MAADAVLDAVILCSQKQLTNRMKVTAMFPEMNPSMDSYRCVLLAGAPTVSCAPMVYARSDTQAEHLISACLIANNKSVKVRSLDLHFSCFDPPSLMKKCTCLLRRIGTLLELARAMAIKLAEQNLRVRLCVQGSMGVGIFTGVPKQLNGVTTLLQRMDWESGAGGDNEGMVGDYVNFGFVGKEHVVNFNKGSDADTPDTQQDDVFLLICPQNMLGLESSIIGPLSEMVDAAGDRPVIILNPDLTDKVSAQGQQSVRGRQQRLDFANSFETIFQFRNIYTSGTSYFPILGSVVKLGPSEPWVAHQRRDVVNNGGEVYLPTYASETVPDNEVIMTTFSQ